MKPSLAIVLTFFLLAALACRLPALSTGQSTPAPVILADTFFSGQAFIDQNGNGEIDESDPPLPGARFSVAGFGGLTGKDGYASVVIPGGWDKPVTASMTPPEDSGYTLISPPEVTLQNSGPTRADFLFASAPGSAETTRAPAEITPAATPAGGLVTPRVPSANPKPRPSLPGKTQSDLVYCTTAAGVQLKMDLHSPLNLQNPAPLMVYIHGGGWQNGDKSEGAGIAFTPTLLENGYIVATINYRLAPEYRFPAEIEDVRCAIRHLRANATTYGIDPRRIGALGGSAGGHLVALLGTVDDDPPWPAEAYQEAYAGQSSRVQAVVDLYGPADLAAIASYKNAAGAATMRQAFGDDPDSWKTFSPVSYITPDDPPFLILHGEKDDLVPPSQSQTLYDTLQAAGIPAQLVIVKNAGHGLRPTGGTPQPGQKELRQLIFQFVLKYLP